MDEIGHLNNLSFEHSIKTHCWNDNVFVKKWSFLPSLKNSMLCNSGQHIKKLANYVYIVKM